MLGLSTVSTCNKLLVKSGKQKNDRVYKHNSSADISIAADCSDTKNMNFQVCCYVQKAPRFMCPVRNIPFFFVLHSTWMRATTRMLKFRANNMQWYVYCWSARLSSGSKCERHVGIKWSLWWTYLQRWLLRRFLLKTHSLNSYVYTKP